MLIANLSLILTLLLLGLLVYSVTSANKLDIARTRKLALKQSNKRIYSPKNKYVCEPIEMITHEQHRRILRQIIKDLEN
jgi:hypothetical protein